MANRSRRGGGGGGTGYKIIWFLLIAGLIFAFFSIPYDPGVKGIVGVVQSKSETVKKWAEGVGPGISGFIERIIQGGTSNPGINPPSNPDPTTPPDSTTPPEDPADPTGAPPVDATNSLATLATIPIANPTNIPYDRSEWNHWTNVRTCWTVREQVLYRDAQPGTAVLKDNNGNTTTDVNRACEIVGGTWVDPYTNKTFTNPRDLDIDHVIPLSYTNAHNGHTWDSKQKEAYANGLDYSNHLLAVSASANRSKGDKGPGSWKPDNKDNWCEYATSWVTISATWGLSTTNADKDSLTSMLNTCV